MICRYSTRILVFIAVCVLSAQAEEIKRVSYLSDLENEIVREINLARTDPEQYALFVKGWLQYYHGRIRQFPDRGPLRTKEGTRAVHEAVRFLENIEPVDPLRPSEGMSKGASDHVDDQGPTEETGHEGLDGSTTGARVNRYGKWKTRVGENITYGGDIARELVIRLIIDDGVRGRGHRKNIFEPEFSVIGVACGPHKSYGTMCVTTFAAKYLE